MAKVKSLGKLVGQLTIEGLVATCLQSCFQTIDKYPLQKSAILDSGSSLRIFNDLIRFKSFKKPATKEYLIAGNSIVPIKGYGRVDLPIIRTDGSHGILRIKKAAYCPTFAVNVVSFHLLYDQGIRWNTTSTPTQLEHKAGNTICIIERKFGQWVLQYKATTNAGLQAAFAASRRLRRTSRDPRPNAIGDSNLWHFRLGHPGPMTLEKLGISCLGAHLKGPTTVQCRHCCQGKMQRQISRRTPYRPSTPFEEIWIDWSDFTEDYQGYSRVMFITDAYSGMVFPYFLQSHGLGRENRRILQDFFNYIDKQYGFQVKSIRSDNELFSKVVRMELQQRSIRSNPSAPNTQSQNGGAERSGGVIIEKARSMRISARLPHSLWRHVIESACYLRNRTPLSRNDWKSPYEQVFNKLPSVSHLRAYGCRAYAMTAAAQLKTNRRKKLDPRAQLGYLVGYASTNIFKIWVPHKDKVILTRDVLFDENTFFDNKLQLDLLDSVKELIEDFESSKVQPSIWEDDSEEEDSIDQLEDPFDEDYQPSELGSEQDSQQDDQQEEDLQEEDQGLLTPPPSDIDFEEGLRSVFATQLPVAQPEGVRETGPAICPISRNVSGHIPTHTLYDTPEMIDMHFHPPTIVLLESLTKASRIACQQLWTLEMTQNLTRNFPILIQLTVFTSFILYG